MYKRRKDKRQQMQKCERRSWESARAVGAQDLPARPGRTTALIRAGMRTRGPRHDSLQKARLQTHALAPRLVLYTLPRKPRIHFRFRAENLREGRKENRVNVYGHRWYNSRRGEPTGSAGEGFLSDGQKKISKPKTQDSRRVVDHSDSPR